MNNPKLPDKKYGLCLSGGGFRAALYHIGTLAALAERDLLHKVEVLSTVSGGSIIGAYYYLKVKQLLEGKRPGCPIPLPSHYLDIVQEIERDFLKAVQKNLRVRLLYNPYATARMLLEEDYSRSDRLSELLNAFFFNDIALSDDIRLNNIHITPHNADHYRDINNKFDADQYNQAEPCKIPLLTINATCLNTGHPFHFTGSWVGEPQRGELYQIEQNSNVVLPQLRFDGHYQNDRSRPVADWQLAKMNTLKLSDAVAASAAVPGLFPPLPIHDLYRTSGGNEIVVELSDGGVFDNQGLNALLSARCTYIIVSDACGQLEDERLLATDLVNISLRANNIMMERIRGYGYFDLDLRREVGNETQLSDTLRTKFCFINDSRYTHLRELANNTQTMPALPGPVNEPGGVVYRLSAMRTDFDAFSDLEANTLMYQSYCVAQRKLIGVDVVKIFEPARPWHFLAIRDVIKHDLPRLTQHLRVSKEMFFKSFRLAPAQSYTWLLLILTPFILVAASLLCANWNVSIVRTPPQLIEKNFCCGNTTFTMTVPQPLPPALIPPSACSIKFLCVSAPTVTLPNLTWGEFIVYAVTALFPLLPLSPSVRKFFKAMPWLRRFKQNSLTDFGLRIAGIPVTVLAVFASVVVFLYLKIFNPIFLKAGRLKQ